MQTQNASNSQMISLADMTNLTSTLPDPCSILWPPYKPDFKPDPSMRRKICTYLSRLYPLKKVAFFDSILPHTMPSWGKVRIANAGDHMRTRWAQERVTSDSRDASFVRACFSFPLVLSCRYKIMIFLNPQHELNKFAYHQKDRSGWERTVFYGQLEHIIECVIPICPALRITERRLLLLALVTECITEGGNATQHLITQVIDLNAISSVVGRFPYGTINGRFAIVDRSTCWARTVFVDDHVYESRET
jgi:hypothetical protein